MRSGPQVGADFLQGPQDFVDTGIGSPQRLAQGMKRGIVQADHVALQYSHHGQIVERVGYQAEQREQVFRLTEVIEPSPPESCIRDCVRLEGIFEDSRGTDAAHQYGYLARLIFPGLDKTGCFARHIFGLILVCRCPKQLDTRLARPTAPTLQSRPEGFFLRHGEGDEEIGRIQYLSVRAVVFIQENGLARKLFYIFQPGLAPLVDRLFLVADYGHILEVVAQRLEQAVLRPVGILELIDQDVVEAPFYRRVGFRQPAGPGDQVAEIQQVLSLQSLHVGAAYFLERVEQEFFMSPCRW